MTRQRCAPDGAHHPPVASDLVPLDSASDSPHADRLLVVIGAVSGACVALARLASASGATGTSWLMVLLQAAVAAQGGAAVLWVVRGGLRWLVGWGTASHAVRAAYTRTDTPTYTVFLLTLATAAGVQLVASAVWTLLGLFVAAQAWVVRRALPARSRAAGTVRAGAVMALCAVSGCAALMYQGIWQRALARYVGVEQGPATAFALILLVAVSVGVVAGGRLARAASSRLPMVLAVLEGGVAAFGACSLPLIGRVGAAADGSLAVTVAVISAVLALPAFLMGATLPVLVQWLAPSERGTVRAVSRVFGASALGAAAACFVSVDLLFAFTGLRGATWVAVSANLAVAIAALWIGARRASLEALRV